jgi:hypothetical protein
MVKVGFDVVSRYWELIGLSVPIERSRTKIRHISAAASLSRVPVHAKKARLCSQLTLDLWKPVMLEVAESVTLLKRLTPQLDSVEL